MDCLNLSFSVLLPYNDGEDFYYQYINNTKFFSKSFKRYEIGFSYKNLFKTLPNLNPLIFLQRAWTENRKVDVSIELYEDNILILSFEYYIIRDNNQLYIISKTVNDLISHQREDEKISSMGNTGIIYVNKDGLLVFSNEKISEIFNTDKMNLFKNLNFYEFMDKFSLYDNDFITTDEFMDKFKALTSHEIKSITLEANPNIEKEEYYHIEAFPIIYKQKEVYRIDFERITESKQKEILASRLNKILNTMEELAEIALGYYDYKTKNIQWTNEIYEMLETSPENINVSNFEDIYEYIVPEDRIIQKEALSQLSITKPDINFIVKIKAEKSNIKYIHHYYKLFFNHFNQKSLLVIFAQDVTKNEEELKQKDMLIKEVHHRVKNNLQIILSLLNLDLRFNSNDPLSIIEDTRIRLNYMAQLHEKIYKSSINNNIDLKDYLVDIASGILTMYNSSIKINSDMDSVIVDLDLAVPLGLILTEIINNTNKYAFPEKDGNFYIILRLNGDKAILDLYDDGLGLPENFKFEDSVGLGMTVIKSLTQQLEGEISIVPDKGAHFKLILPIKEKNYKSLNH
ncbi:MAG: sensor histidine kinase [Methanobacteriaceae archaeon]|uniref:sensor histidine kinase n=1 Tax=unclassified Methanobrevibacter TaxID=2638681 RepID=UPI00375F5C0D|nr:sensor histidine kinase [Methanobacteriaceae archaeon]MDD4594676.1 sensor histidine kinase [Methanobacteriaceae archaeon]